ncbi:MAG: hypothetical protein Q9170_003729 [Blastenia crenularia]
MRRSSMRRGSAVLLTILPLLSPAYGLPTYFNNDASVAHANVERAAIPAPAVNLDTAEAINEKRGAENAVADWENEAVPEWLPKNKRFNGAGLSTGSVSLDLSGNPAGGSGSSNGDQPDTIGNLGSEGPAAWLRPVSMPVKREAEAQPNPAVTLDMEMNLGKPYKRRVLSV